MKLGDANRDGIVNAAANLQTMDVNLDGRVDLNDAEKLLRFVDGLDPNL